MSTSLLFTIQSFSGFAQLLPCFLALWAPTICMSMQVSPKLATCANRRNDGSTSARARDTFISKFTGTRWARILFEDNFRGMMVDEVTLSPVLIFTWNESSTPAFTRNHFNLKYFFMQVHMALAAKCQAIAHFIAQFWMRCIWLYMMGCQSFLSWIALAPAFLADILITLQNSFTPRLITFILKAFPGLAAFPVIMIFSAKSRHSCSMLLSKFVQICRTFLYSQRAGATDNTPNTRARFLGENFIRSNRKALFKLCIIHTTIIAG